jgi:hypothetical protein
MVWSRRHKWKMRRGKGGRGGEEKVEQWKRSRGEGGDVEE